MKTYEYRYVVIMRGTVQAEKISDAAAEARKVVNRVKDARLLEVVQIYPPIDLPGAAPEPKRG